LCGCLAFPIAPVVPPIAATFTSVQAPVDITYNLTEIGSKKGEAGSVCILGLLAFGDCSVKTAAKDGNLKRVDHIGYEYTNVLGLVSFYTTVVYGE
ncbi:MAG: hypothetical protein KAS38_09765, partial [Anaerolineales bacterium]|nr:hypothetical protein [Anaerolineales bacterium]